MPVYNAEEYLVEAIDSVLLQTFTNFRLLLINDGCTDGSQKIIDSYSDERIDVLINDENLGLIATLNRGLDAIETKYIVRTDADDICAPNRLQLEYDFMESNPEVGICGGWFNNFSEDGEQGGARYKSSDFEIKLSHLYQIHISHGTAIFRTAVFKKHKLKFDPAFKHAEDYDLFDRAGTICQLANIPNVVYKVRQHDSSVSKVFADVQNANSQLVKQRIFKRIGVTGEEIEQELYRNLIHQDYTSLKPKAEDLLNLLNQLFEANHSSNEFETRMFQNHLKQCWFHFCNAIAGKDFNGNAWYGKADFTMPNDLTLSEKGKLFLKQLLR